MVVENQTQRLDLRGREFCLLVVDIEDVVSVLDQGSRSCCGRNHKLIRKPSSLSSLSRSKNVVNGYHDGSKSTTAGVQIV